MTDPITPTGKRLFANWYNGVEPTYDPLDSILAIEREAREPTDDGLWADVDTLAAALATYEQPGPEPPDGGHWSANALKRHIAAAIIQAAKEAERRRYYGLGTDCHADRDGDCDWSECPQTRDGEPAKTGRHCPLDVGGDGA